MFELLPSRQMREYYEENGMTLSDFEQATLVWNSLERSRTEKLEALTEISEKTEDLELKQQIQERLHYEELVWKEFTDNSERKYIYVSAEYDDNTYPDGFFWDFETAFEYTKEICADRKMKYVIWKEKVSEAADEAGKGYSYMVLNNRGEILNIYVMDNENLKEDEEKVGEEKTDRFEHKFFELPFLFQGGSAVKSINSDEIGVLAEGPGDWKKYTDWLKNNGILKEDNLTFSDINVANVYFLQEDGSWYHDHVRLLNIETVEVPVDFVDKKEEVFWTAMKAMGKCLSGHDTEKQNERALKYSKKYAKLCQKTAFDEREINEVWDLIC